MTPRTNELDETLRAQLCAWMDGELPADETRFFERRLASDPALRAAWERMQLASACLKGHAFRPMPNALAEGVAAALAARRAGIRTFILPRKNERDMMEIPKHLRQDIEFVLVDRIDDVLSVALLPPNRAMEEF